MQAVKQTIKAETLSTVMKLPKFLRNGYVDVFVCPSDENCEDEIPNEETLQAIEEVRQLKSDPNKKVYNSFKEFMMEVDEELASNV